MGEDWSDVIRHHAHAPSVGAVVIPRWRGRWQKAKCATVAVHRRFLSPFRNLQSDRVFSTLCYGRIASVVAKKVNIGVGSCRAWSNLLFAIRIQLVFGSKCSFGNWSNFGQRRYLCAKCTWTREGRVTFEEIKAKTCLPNGTKMYRFTCGL